MFLDGLDDIYDSIRSEILQTMPFPDPESDLTQNRTPLKPSFVSCPPTDDGCTYCHSPKPIVEQVSRRRRTVILTGGKLSRRRKHAMLVRLGSTAQGGMTRSPW